jgi:hypothetical protein
MCHMKERENHPLLNFKYHVRKQLKKQSGKLYEKALFWAKCANLKQHHDQTTQRKLSFGQNVQI